MASEKHIKATYGKRQCYVQQFNSINEFLKFIKEQPVNKAFEGAYLSSEEEDHYGNWHGTKTIDEAFGLLEHGWTTEAEKLTQTLKASVSSVSQMKHPKQIKSVAGFHPIVPNYLAGNPQSMVSTKMVVKKQKVVTLVRQGNFLGYVTSDEIEKEAIKAFKIIKRIEAQGYRVNLFAAYCSEDRKSGTSTLLLIKLKGADEKLNISKLAFPLCNTAMFRRLVFKWREKFEHTPRGMRGDYGSTISLTQFMHCFGKQGVFPKGSYGINNYVKFDIDKMRGFENLVELG